MKKLIWCVACFLFGILLGENRVFNKFQGASILIDKPKPSIPTYYDKYRTYDHIKYPYSRD